MKIRVFWNGDILPSEFEGTVECDLRAHPGLLKIRKTIPHDTNTFIQLVDEETNSINIPFTSIRYWETEN